jgi:hypothetical protein
MTFDDVRKISLAWPEVEDGTSYGTPALKVRRNCWCGSRKTATAW